MFKLGVTAVQPQQITQGEPVAKLSARLAMQDIQKKTLEVSCSLILEHSENVGE